MSENENDSVVIGEIEEVDKKINQLMERYKSAQIPPPTTYRFGDNEFIFRCQQIAIVNIICKRFGISENEFDLELKKVWLHQAEMLYKNMTKSVIKPDKPKMFLPPGMENGV